MCIYIYIKLTCHKAHTRHKPPHYPFGCFFTHACQDMIYVRKHQLRRSKLFWNLQVEILLLTWPRSPLSPSRHAWLAKDRARLDPWHLEGFESVHHKSIRNSSSRYPTPKETPFQTIIDGIWLKSLGCRCRLSRIQELCCVKMKDANAICLQQLSRKRSFKQATLAWNAICPLWLGIFHSIFPSQLLNSKKRQEITQNVQFPPSRLFNINR